MPTRAVMPAILKTNKIDHLLIYIELRYHLVNHLIEELDIVLGTLTGQYSNGTG